jgi:hypothetical protein
MTITSVKRNKSLFQKYGRIAILAFMLFLASCVFFEIFARLSVVYSATEISMADACEWDCGWYLRIVKDGYLLEPDAHPRGDAANWAFFPLFPLIAKVLNAFGVDAGFALVTTSKLSLFFAIYFFMRLATEELGEAATLPGGALVAFNPYLIYAHAGYTESLYLALTCAAFLALRHNNWIRAGFYGALLSATRLIGILLVISNLLKMLSEYRKSPVEIKWQDCLLALLITPLGLALFMIYLHHHVGDALAFKHIQVAWSREVSNPVINLVSGFLEGGWSGYYATVATISLLSGLWLTVTGRAHYGLFLIGATLIPLSTGLASMPRYIFWQAPFLLCMVDWILKKEYLPPIFLAFSSAMAAFITISWFTGKGFVI